MLKKLLLATAALGFSGAALAHPPHWAPAYGYRAHHYYPAYRPIYVAPAYRPVYVVPRPVYRPVVPVAPAYPIAPGISIRLNFPL
jgi:hypothetical protein